MTDAADRVDAEMDAFIAEQRKAGTFLGNAIVRAIRAAEARGRQEMVAEIAEAAANSCGNCWEAFVGNERWEGCVIGSCPLRALSEDAGAAQAVEQQGVCICYGMAPGEHSPICPAASVQPPARPPDPSPISSSAGPDLVRLIHEARGFVHAYVRGKAWVPGTARPLLDRLDDALAALDRAAPSPPLNLNRGET